MKDLLQKLKSLRRLNISAWVDYGDVPFWEAEIAKDGDYVHWDDIEAIIKEIEKE